MARSTDREAGDKPAQQTTTTEDEARLDAPGGLSWADFVNRDRSADPE